MDVGIQVGVIALGAWGAPDTCNPKKLTEQFIWKGFLTAQVIWKQQPLKFQLGATKKIQLGGNNVKIKVTTFIYFFSWKLTAFLSVFETDKPWDQEFTIGESEKKKEAC